MAGGILEYRGLKLGEDHSLSFGGFYRTLGTRSNKDDTEAYSPYLQDVWSLSPKIDLTLGLRFYYVEKNRYESWAATGGSRRMKRKNERHWCPKMHLEYRPTPYTTVCLSISRAYRLPTP